MLHSIFLRIFLACTIVENFNNNKGRRRLKPTRHPVGGNPWLASAMLLKLLKKLSVLKGKILAAYSADFFEILVPPTS
jgi:hypothetical protein